MGAVPLREAARGSARSRGGVIQIDYRCGRRSRYRAELEVGLQWDVPSLVLEYIEGDSVEQLGKALDEVLLHVPAAIVVRIIADAALGLHEAHDLTSPDAWGTRL